jgi:ribonuclease BN (tRNA processing enzyme)
MFEKICPILIQVMLLNSIVPAQNHFKPTVDSTFVVLLGTGMPRPDPKAQGPATAIVLGDRVFLFDAGPGVERQLSAAKLPIKGVTAVFITHLHSDHTLGYPDLIFTSWVMGRKLPLQVYGPHGLQKMTDHLIAAWEEDIKVRIDGLEHQTKEGYKVTVHEIKEGIVYDSGGVRVTAIPVVHGNWAEAFAYRIDTPDRSVVISGDAKYCESIEQASKGVDVLVHEVYPASKVKVEERPGGDDWPQYLKEFHTSDVELGTLASKAQPHVLILTHIVRMGATDAELLEGIRKGGFTGKVLVGKDLGRY